MCVPKKAASSRALQRLLAIAAGREGARDQQTRASRWSQSRCWKSAASSASSRLGMPPSCDQSHSGASARPAPGASARPARGCLASWRARAHPRAGHGAGIARRCRLTVLAGGGWARWSNATRLSRPCLGIPQTLGGEAARQARPYRCIPLALDVRRLPNLHRPRSLYPRRKCCHLRPR